MKFNQKFLITIYLLKFFNIFLKIKHFELSIIGIKTFLKNQSFNLGRPDLPSSAYLPILTELTVWGLFGNQTFKNE